ncbi:hypothetical protein D0544_11455 [Aestuariirhabdus litorea]|uniref:Uncharacterized protein n=2 Tax=Aestuariirhabdus litorea TaxID=2528527 RepID=A0A3P3VNT5_9GAMM|nr:hypothetical protein D0544_11455 [Aestuariirhabdus litorea]RWW92644.1 hypothetical protein DZC74_11430 [Endozoicomonadaceae bacterium GTF-13]
MGNAYGHTKGVDGKDKGSKGLGNNHGAVASSLGRLNAAHASATARANASPNSAVGRIAAYEAAVNEALSLNEAYQSQQSNIEALETALNDLKNDPNATQEAIDTAQTALDEAVAEAETNGLADSIAAADEASMEALAAAANKEVDDSVVSAVNDLLGIN